MNQQNKSFIENNVLVAIVLIELTITVVVALFGQREWTGELDWWMAGGGVLAALVIVVAAVRASRQSQDHEQPTTEADDVE